MRAGDDRDAAVGGGEGRGRLAGGPLPELGARREGDDLGPVVGRALEDHRQRLPRPARLLHQLDRRPLREDRRGRAHTTEPHTAGHRSRGASLTRGIAHAAPSCLGARCAQPRPAAELGAASRACWRRCKRSRTPSASTRASAARGSSPRSASAACLFLSAAPRGRLRLRLGAAYARARADWTGFERPACERARAQARSDSEKKKRCVRQPKKAPWFHCALDAVSGCAGNASRQRLSEFRHSFEKECQDCLGSALLQLTFVR